MQLAAPRSSKRRRRTYIIFRPVKPPRQPEGKCSEGDLGLLALAVERQAEACTYQRPRPFTMGYNIYCPDMILVGGLNLSIEDEQNA